MSHVNDCVWFKYRDIITICLWIVTFAVCVGGFCLSEDRTRPEYGACAWASRFIIGMVCVIVWEYVMALVVVCGIIYLITQQCNKA